MNRMRRDFAEHVWDGAAMSERTPIEQSYLEELSWRCDEGLLDPECGDLIEEILHLQIDVVQLRAALDRACYLAEQLRREQNPGRAPKRAGCYGPVERRLAPRVAGR